MITIFLFFLTIVGISPTLEPTQVDAVYNGPALRLPWLTGSYPLSGSSYGCGLHSGPDAYAVDFGLPYGYPVTAVFAGTVNVEAEQDNGYGKNLTLTSIADNDYVAIYAHLSDFVPDIDDDVVTQGQVIGYLGNTGRVFPPPSPGNPTSGKHLHFVLRKNGAAEKPEPMSGYEGGSGFSRTCLAPATSTKYNPEPGGWWIGPTPSDLAVKSPSSTVEINFRAVDNQNGGLSRIDITYWTATTGWRKIAANQVTLSGDSSQKDAYTTLTMPNEELQVSVNVYGSNGSFQKAPSGIRHFCPSGTCTLSRFPSGGVADAGGRALGGAIPDGVVLCTSTSLNGTCKIFGSGVVDNLTLHGISDDIESVAVPHGYTLILNDNTNLAGTNKTLTSDDLDLSTTSWHNRAKSMWIKTTHNIAAQATLDHSGAGNAVDENLYTHWEGGNGEPLGLVYSVPVTVNEIVVFDRDPTPTQNEIFTLKLVFSDGTVISDIDMDTRCADVSFPAKEVTWINVVPQSYTGSNGFKEIQVWDASVTGNTSNACINKISTSASAGSGPAPDIAGSGSLRMVDPSASDVATLTTAGPQTNQVITAAFGVMNVGGTSLTIQNLVAATRLGDDWNDPAYDFPADSSITLDPGEVYYYRQQRGFSSNGTYFVQPVAQIGGNWASVSSSNPQNFVVSAPDSPTQGAQTSATIYGDSLASGWNDYSWNSTNDHSDSGRPYAGTDAILWQPDGPYAGLLIYADDPVDTSGYNALTFAVKGTWTGQTYGVSVYDAEGNGTGSLLPLASWGGDPVTDHYRVYTIPLSAFGAVNTEIMGFHIQDLNGSDTPAAAYVDRIMLSGDNGDPWVNLPGNAYLAYNDGLAANWQDWSWDSTVNWSSTASQYTGSNHIAWTINSAWGGLDLHKTSAQSASGYATLHFAMKASTSGQEFAIGLQSPNGTVLKTPIPLTDYGGDPVTGWWKRYDIPLADLGIDATHTSFTDIVIQDNTGGSQAVVYVDEVGIY